LRATADAAFDRAKEERRDGGAASATVRSLTGKDGLDPVERPAPGPPPARGDDADGLPGRFLPHRPTFRLMVRAGECIDCRRV
jgi:hypothetical protein